MKLPFVETMIIQACNLSCQGCSNHSDLTYSGYIPWNQGKIDIENWLTRLDIDEFGIIGGEPLLNPQWQLWLTGCRDLMPLSGLRFTTNGSYLYKYPDILDFCEHVGNMIFKITVHTPDDRLEQSIKSLINARKWETVTEFGVKRFLGPNRLRFQINRPDRFIMTYRNTRRNMQPWHSDAAAAFGMCCQQTCPLLYQGRLYKCSTSALLDPTLLRFGNPNFDEWAPYRDDGVGVDDSDLSIDPFLSNFGKPHIMCGQCPDSDLGYIDHAHTVRFKKSQE